MGTAERRAREKTKRRQEILQAAREVFFAEGMHQATVDDVAARAEVSKGTIYLYFPSKESILAHLLLEGLAILLREMNQAYARRDSLSAEERIRRLANVYFRFSHDYPHYFRLLSALDRGRFQEGVPPKLYAKIVAQSTRGLKLVERALRQGVQTGEFACDDPWQAAGVLWAALNGVFMLMAHPLRQQMLATDEKTMFDASLNLILRGLRRVKASDG